MQTTQSNKFATMQDKVLNSDLSRIQTRFTQKYPTLDSNQAMTEYKNFMLLCSVSKDNIPVPNQLVDEMWHTHILFTSDYYSFCSNVVGKFVHHIPPMQQYSFDEIKLRKEKVINLCKQTFGTVPFSSIDEKTICDSGSYCDSGSQCESSGDAS